MNFNKVIICGNITREIETIDANGTTLAKFAIANNKSYISKSGEKVKKPCFIDCVAFGRTAENIAKFFQKGDPILVDGELELDQWDDKDGNRRSKHKINVTRFDFVPKSQQADQQAAQVDDADFDDIPF